MTKNLRYFCTLLLMAVVGVAWAQTTHTIGWGTASGEEGTYTNFTDVSGTVQGILSFSTEKNGAGSNPAYNAGASELRLYYGSQGNGGSITITPADGVTITGAVMMTSTSPSVAYTVDGGTATSVSVSNNTYTISDISATSSLKIQNVNTSNTQLRIKTIAITYTTSGNIVATTTTIDASNITTTDVYLGTEAGSLSAVVTETESGDVVAGAPVTWTSSKENVATIDENGTVTLVAAGTTTITASYEGVSGEFGASSATYELTVTSSAPYEQPTEFEIGLNNVLFGTEYTGSASGINDENPVVGTQDNVTVTYAGSGNHYVNDAQIRFYSGNKLTFEAPEGYEIKEIVFTSAGTWTATITADGYDSSTKTWTGSATSVLFTGSGSGRCDMSKASITLGLPSTDPIINASDVNIAYDATSGEITYTITNPVTGKTLQAYADVDWVSDITVGDEAITFTTTANELKTERVATFTLTYEGAEGKTVTVTQAGNPNIIDKIENISESGVPYNVQGTVVATSARAFVIGDGTGYIYYYNGNTAPSVSVGDMVKISGTTGNYGNVIQFTNAATITEATESEYTPMTPGAMTEVPDYTSGLYKSDYYQFEGMLTKSGSNYIVAVGEGQVRISYPSTSQTTELEALLDKTVKVKGFFAGNSTYNNNTIFTAIMESIEEVVSDEPSINLASYEVEVNANAHTTPTTIAVTYANIDFENDVPKVVFYESDGSTETTYDWLFVDLDADWNVYYTIEENTNNAARTAYFKVLGYDSNGNNVYSNLASITQAAYDGPVAVLYTYSRNGVGDDYSDANTGETIALDGSDDLEGFNFVGWTLNPNDVDNLLNAGDDYTFENDVIFYAVYEKADASRANGDFVKVTSTDDIENGTYLIVYEDGSVAFNGSLESFDAVENSINVEINQDVIAYSSNVEAASFTIEEIDGGYSIQGTNGKYLSVNSYNNGLVSSETPVANGIVFENNNVLITRTFEAGNMTLKYNSASNQLRFRYYKSGQQDIQLYKQESGATTTPTRYTRVFINETVAGNITIVGPSIIPAGQTLDMGENYILENNPGADRLVIEDGGQLKISNSVNGTVLKNITGYSSYTGTGNGGYYLIATPATLDATNQTNMFPSVASDHQYVDFYGFDQTMVAQEWRNYKYGNESFAGPLGMEQGKGYLYASKNDVTLTLRTLGLGGIIGGNYQHTNYPFEPTHINKPVAVSYNVEGINQQEVVFKGYNLIGNPFTCKAYLADGRDFYRMNEAGDKIVVATDKAINVAEGIFVIAESGETSVTFTTTDPTVTSTGGVLNITLSQAQSNRGNAATIDAARIRFGEGRMLPKFDFMGNNGGISIPQGSKDYAVVRSQGEGELPVNFKADKNGAYTLSVRPENVEMDYLHLIDNMTGAEVDLLATPTYTFNAKKTDYASRFRLVFSATGVEENGTETNASFAFFNGSEWVVNANDNATLEVIDMMGRTVLCRDVARNVSTNGWAQGVYMFRLTDGNSVKTQKIVVR